MLILRSRFRWAACQLDLLGECFSVRHLRQALVSLPKTLDDTYARILLNIDKNHNHYYPEILKILQWLSFSAQPLQLEELAEIVAIDINETARFDPERRWPNPQDILIICSSLVTLTTEFYDSIDRESSSLYNEEERHTELNANSQERDNDSVWAEASESEGSVTFVRLAHFSVKEYLVSDRIQHGIAARYSIREIQSHGVLAGDCIAYLLQFDKPDLLTSETLKLSPLARYAAEHWTSHARKAQKGPVKAAASLSMELLMSGEGGLLNWVRIANPEDDQQEDLGLGIGDVAPPLYYASLAGLSELVNMIIEKEVDVNVKGGYHGNALCACCYAKNHEIAELLLHKGADIDASGEGESDHGTALQIASEFGCENIVKLLLYRDADVNATSTQDNISPLEHASLHGYENIVKILLDKGADIKPPRDSIGALQWASAYGHGNIVKILLDEGADFNPQE